MGDIIFGICIVILLVVFITSPLIAFIFYKRKKNSVKVGNIYLRYIDRRNPFGEVRQIFKVIDKRDGYIQYEIFKSTHDALNNVAWYDDGERKIDSMSLNNMVNLWDDFECWLDVDEK